MKLTIIIISAVISLAACGSGANNSANNSNARNGSSAAGPSPSISVAANTEKGANLSPTTMSVSEFMVGYDDANEGRIVTVDGALLEEIKYDSLLMRDGAGYGFGCNGSFSEYMEMRTRIDDMRYKHKSPVATVKGVYTVGNNGKPALRSCVLIDLKK